jgi:Spy/CpxP family protein refolding chaperone
MAYASGYISDRLHLTPAQRGDLDHVLGELQSKFEEARGEGRDHPVLDLVLAEHPDRDAIVAAIDERSQRMKESMTAAVDIGLPFLASLTPEQRAELKTVMSERHRRGPFGQRHDGWFGD